MAVAVALSVASASARPAEAVHRPPHGPGSNPPDLEPAGVAPLQAPLIHQDSAAVRSPILGLSHYDFFKRFGKGQRGGGMFEAGGVWPAVPNAPPAPKKNHLFKFPDGLATRLPLIPKPS